MFVVFRFYDRGIDVWIDRLNEKDRYEDGFISRLRAGEVYNILQTSSVQNTHTHTHENKSHTYNTHWLAKLVTLSPFKLALHYSNHTVIK